MFVMRTWIRLANIGMLVPHSLSCQRSMREVGVFTELELRLDRPFALSSQAL